MTRPLIVLLAVLASLGAVHSYTVSDTAYFDHGPTDTGQSCGSITFSGSIDWTSNGVFQELSLPSVSPPYYWVLRGIGINVQQALTGPIDMAVYLSDNASSAFYHPAGNPIAQHQFSGLVSGDNQFPTNPNDTAAGWSFDLGRSAQTLWVFLNQPPAQPLQFRQSCRFVPNPVTGTGPLHRLGALSSVFANKTFWDIYTQDMSTFPWASFGSDPFTTNVALSRWRPVWWLIADLAYDPVAGSPTPSRPPCSASLTPSPTTTNSPSPTLTRSPSESPTAPFSLTGTRTVGSLSPTPTLTRNMTATKKKNKDHPITEKHAGVPVWGWILVGVGGCCCIILLILCIAVLIGLAVFAKKKHRDYHNYYG